MMFIKLTLLHQLSYTNGDWQKGKLYQETTASVRGWSAYAKRDFWPGDFVCEYRGVLKSKSESLQDEQEYRELGIGCYCLDVQYQGSTFTIDAIDIINDPACYINHASKNANLQKMCPVVTGVGKRRKPRVGFTAVIQKGDELFFD